MRTTHLLTTAATGLVLLGAATQPALGKGGDDDVRKAGSCSARSESKLKLSPEDGRVEVEFEVDENRTGRTWDVVVRAGGKRVLKRAAVTRGPSGSFEVRTVVASGTDVSARAVSRRTGETCRASASL